MLCQNIILMVLIARNAEHGHIKVGAKDFYL